MPGLVTESRHTQIVTVPTVHRQEEADMDMDMDHSTVMMASAVLVEQPMEADILPIRRRMEEIMVVVTVDIPASTVGSDISLGIKRIAIYCLPVPLHGCMYEKEVRGPQTEKRHPCPLQRLQQQLATEFQAIGRQTDPLLIFI